MKSLRATHSPRFHTSSDPQRPPPVLSASKQPCPWHDRRRRKLPVIARVGAILALSCACWLLMLALAALTRVVS